MHKFPNSCFVGLWRDGTSWLPVKRDGPTPANTVRNITFVKVPFSSFMDDRNEDVLRT